MSANKWGAKQSLRQHGITLKHAPLNLSIDWLQILMIVLLVLGVLFRFTHLDHKVYWHDETFTSLRISGYTVGDIRQAGADGHILTPADLQVFQQVNPNRGLRHTVMGLAQGEPQHPPLYFVLVRLWAGWFGSTVADVRCFPAILSLLAFPCMYWLCLELFRAPPTGWLGMGLIAISPFHVLYAQESRQYSLWTVTILLSGAALLRAMRVKTVWSWGLYAVSVALGFYTFLLSVLVAAGHGLYVLLLERGRLTKTVLGYGLATVGAGLSFVPWVAVLMMNRSSTDSVTGWAFGHSNWTGLVKLWILNLGRLFVDVDFSLTNPLTYSMALVLLLIGYALYFIVRHTPIRVWLFVLILTGLTPLALVLPDLLLGGKSSTISRYLVPTDLGIQLAVTALFTHTALNSTNRPRQQAVWRVGLALVLSIGLLSDLASSPAQVWWHKYMNEDNPPIAADINQTPGALIWIDTDASGWAGNLLSLSYLLAPNTQIQLVTTDSFSTLPNAASALDPGGDRLYLFNPTLMLRQQVETTTGQTLESAYKGRYLALWQM